MASALSQLTDAVTTLVSTKAKASVDQASRFNIVPSHEPSSSIVPFGSISRGELISVTLTGAEIAEIAMSQIRVKNAAKHLKFTVAERLEKTAHELKQLADSEIENIESIQQTAHGFIQAAHARNQE